MRLRLLAAREPYRSFAVGAGADEGFELEILSPESLRPSSPTDLSILPADCFLELEESSRPLPVFAYGPTALMSAAFHAGCLDYLREPWNLAELFARAGRLQRLRTRSGGMTMELGCRRLRLRATGQGREPCFSAAEGALELGEAEARLLRLLMLNAGRPVPRAALCFALWGEERRQSRAPDVHISALRKRLETACPGMGGLICSSRGLGYRLLMETCA